MEIKILDSNTWKIDLSPQPVKVWRTFFPNILKLSEEVSNKILAFLKSPKAKDFQTLRNNTKKMPFVALGILIIGWIIYLINNQVWNIVLILGLVSFVWYYIFSQNQKINWKTQSEIKNKFLSDACEIFLAKKINFANDQKFFKYNLENILSWISNYEKLVKQGSFETENVVGQKFFTQKRVSKTTTDHKTNITKTTTHLEKDKDFLLVSISKPWEYSYLTSNVNIFRNKNFFEKMFQTNQVKLEDIRFENVFDATGDQITARQVLNQDFMEKLTTLWNNENIVGFVFQNWLVHILYDISWKDFLNLSTFVWEKFLINQIYENVWIIKNIFNNKEILKI